jgi:ferredoxin
MAGLRIRVDRDRCIGAGRCVATASDLFDQREDDGLVVLLQEKPAPAQHDKARRAAANCPARVIEIIEG